MTTGRINGAHVVAILLITYEFKHFKMCLLAKTKQKKQDMFHAFAYLF